MSKTLVVIRHAKAQNPDGAIIDFERSLTETGKSDAEKMGQKLAGQKLSPGLIISSPAKRTRQTAKRIAKELNYNIEHIIWNENLYHCTPELINAIVSEITDSVSTAFIVGHNPGVTEFAANLDAAFRIENLPPCGVVGVKIEAGQWEKFDFVPKKVFLFEFPKK